MAVTQVKFINMLIMLVSSIHHANNTRVSTYNTSVVPLMFAVTAFGHHPDLMMMVYLAASPLSLTLSTMSLSTISSVVLTR
jgi:hypothetical protein